MEATKATGAFILAIPLTYCVRWGVIHIFELAEIPLNASTRLRLHDSSGYLFFICFVLFADIAESDDEKTKRASRD